MQTLRRECNNLIATELSTDFHSGFSGLRYKASQIRLIRYNNPLTAFALIYPNSYYLGMSSLGFLSIYYQLNRREDTFCDRCFLPDIAHQKELIRSNTSLFSLETFQKLTEFDILGFSISFEGDYFNILRILNLAKIPPLSGQRDENYPLIIAGGISVSYNPEPLADFVDAFVIGEAEINIHPLLSEYRVWKENRGKKQELLKNLTKLDGIYVPQFYEVEYRSNGTLKHIKNRNPAPPKVKSGIVDNIDEIETSSKILTPNTEFANTCLIEIARGCGRQCRFCIADYAKRPPRYRSVENTQKLAEQASGYTNRIGLLGAAVSDHPQIDEIAQNLVKLGFQISCASLRVETVRPALLDALAESGQNAITIAPEVATEQLQKIINKSIQLEQLYYVFQEALKRDIFNIKLYFMIGLPYETPADIEAIVKMVRTLRAIMLPYARKRGRMGKLICSISPFVPKPHTPFQWCMQEDIKTISKKLDFLKHQLNQLGSVQLSSSSARLAKMEGVLARGDRRLGTVIYDVANGISFNKALRKWSIDANFYTRCRNFDEILPWSHINLGVNSEYLQSEYTKHFKGLLTNRCRVGTCKKCGGCDRNSEFGIRNAELKEEGIRNSECGMRNEKERVH